MWFYCSEFGDWYGAYAKRLKGCFIHIYTFACVCLLVCVVEWFEVYSEWWECEYTLPPPSIVSSCSITTQSLERNHHPATYMQNIPVKKRRLHGTFYGTGGGAQPPTNPLSKTRLGCWTTTPGRRDKISFFRYVMAMQYNAIHIFNHSVPWKIIFI